MSRIRRIFEKDFKAKVVLEALKEKDTIEVLAKKYKLLPNQISTWKSEAIRNLAAVF
jgi:transposase